MKSLLSMVMLACLSAAVCAQNAPDDDAKKPATESAKKSVPQPLSQPGGRIFGHVLCGDTHKPARGALVLVQSLPPVKPSGDAIRSSSVVRVAFDGSFLAEHLTPGDYAVIATLPGYRMPLDRIVVEQDDTKLENARKQLVESGSVITIHGVESETLELTLERGAVVSGRILYPDGAPAQLVGIRVEPVTTSTPVTDKVRTKTGVGDWILNRWNRVPDTTDDRGNFRISGLSPGTYRIVATPPVLDQKAVGADEGTGLVVGGYRDFSGLEVYGGDTLRVADATKYELKTGQEISGIQIVLPIGDLHRVGGNLHATDGRTINMGSLQLTDTVSEAFHFEAGVRADGTFLFPAVPPGTYLMKVEKPRIGRISADDEDMRPEYATLQETDAFADGSMTLIVKEDDVADVNFSLPEIPLPKKDRQNTPDDDK